MVEVLHAILHNPEEPLSSLVGRRSLQSYTRARVRPRRFQLRRTAVPKVGCPWRRRRKHDMSFLLMRLFIKNIDNYSLEALKIVIFNFIKEFFNKLS